MDVPHVPVVAAVSKMMMRTPWAHAAMKIRTPVLNLRRLNVLPFHHIQTTDHYLRGWVRGQPATTIATRHHNESILNDHNPFPMGRGFFILTKAVFDGRWGGLSQVGPSVYNTSSTAGEPAEPWTQIEESTDVPGNQCPAAGSQGPVRHAS